MDNAILVWGGLGVCMLLLLYVIVNIFKMPDETLEAGDYAVAQTAARPRDVETRDEILTRDSLIADLKEQLKHTGSELERSRNERKTLNDTIARLRGEIEASRGTVAEKIESVQDPLREEIQSLNEEIFALKEDQAALLSQKQQSEERGASYEEQASALKAELDGLSGKLESTKKMLFDEQASSARLAAAVKEKEIAMEDLATKIIGFTRELSEARDEGVRLREELESVKKDKISLESSLPQKINQAKAVQQRAVNTLKRERDQLIEQKAEIDRQLAVSSRKIVTLTRELDHSRHALETTRVSADSIASEKELTNLRAENDGLKERYEKELTQLRAEGSSLKADLEAEVSGLKEENKTLREKIESLGEELSAAYESIPAKVRQSRAALQEELDAMRADHAELLEQKTEADKRLAYFKEEKDILENQLKASPRGKDRRRGMVSEV